MSFMDKNDTFVILNCYIKKTNKIPGKEIKLAKSLMNKYLNETT